MVPFSVTLSDLSTSFQGHFSFLHEMMQSNATMTEMQYKTTKITSNDHNVHFKVMANVFLMYYLEREAIYFRSY